MNIYKCSNCGEVYTQGGTGRPMIGKPFVECEVCKAPIRLARINEWDLREPSEKLGYIVYLLYITMMFGAVVGVLFAGLGMAAGIKSDALVILLIFIGVFGVALIVNITFRSNIRKSRERLGDPTYRLQLRQIGLLRDISKLH